MPEVCENRNHQVVICVSFVSDWLRHWRKTFRPIIEQSKAKQCNLRLLLTLNVKIALLATLCSSGSYIKWL